MVLVRLKQILIGLLLVIGSLFWACSNDGIVGPIIHNDIENEGDSADDPNAAD